MKRHALLITLITVNIAIFTLAGCGAKTPPCADPKSIDLVRQIFHDALQKQAVASGLDKSLADQITSAVQITVTMIRTANRDDKLDKYTCEASLEAKLPDKLVQTIGNTPVRLSELVEYEPSGGHLKSRVQYTSQTTDDTKQHLVELRGYAPLAEVLLVFAAKDAFKPEQPASPAHQRFPVLDKYVGLHPTEIFKEPIIAQRFKTLLSANYDNFYSNLSVSTTLRAADSYYIGSGCAPHSCGTEEAAFTIDKGGLGVYAVLLLEGKQFKAFGVAKMASLPAPLLEWVKERGGQLE